MTWSIIFMNHKNVVDDDVKWEDTNSFIYDLFFFCSFLWENKQLFEGMKAYRGVDGRIRIFRPNMNMNRMNLSAKRSGLPTFDGDEFIKCLSRLVSIDQEWVPHTEQASLYIRPTLIGIDVSISHLQS